MNQLKKSSVMAVLTNRIEPCRLSVIRGSLWITGESDKQDYVLQRGETFECKDRGKIVIEALEESSFTMELIPCPVAKSRDYSTLLRKLVTILFGRSVFSGKSRKPQIGSYFA